MKKVIYGLLVVCMMVLFAGCEKKEKENEYDKTLSCLLTYQNDQGYVQYTVNYKDEVAKKAVVKYYTPVPVSEEVPLSEFYASYTEQHGGVNEDHKYEVIITEEGTDKIGQAYVFEFDKLVNYDNMELDFVLKKDYNIADYSTILISHGYTCETK